MPATFPTFQQLLNLFRYDGAHPLLFHDGTFLVLFTLFFTVYAFIYRFKTARMIYLLLFSLFFYWKSSGLYLAILLFTIAFDYCITLLIVRSSKAVGRIWLIASLLVNLGLLGWFKYTNFFLSNLSLFTGQNYPLIDLVLPIGISFYTFQTISYVVDVYQRKIEPAQSLLDYAFYMSFFPHLVAGPIVRASDFLPQLRADNTLSPAMLNFGLWSVFRGLIKKAIIADYIAQYADIVYAAPQTYSGFENLMAMYCYTLQIYCDFSGYSDMAIGLAALMGYKLCENFNHPYRSADITEFWRKWHISLSSWLRDYVYIPLGGNRSGAVRQQVNLMLTMLIGGLWHGANWKFVIWGGLHGLALAIHKLWRIVTKPFPILNNSLVARFIGWAITLHFVAVLWVFFRASSTEAAIASLKAIALNNDPLAYALPFWQTRSTLVIMLLTGYALVLLKPEWKNWVYTQFAGSSLILKGLMFLVIVQVILQFRTVNVQPFIYFQF
ncbi:MAG: MBOAT family protein [Bacteroidota bacterium]